MLQIEENLKHFFTYIHKYASIFKEIHIIFRYAVTKVEAHMKNPNAESCQAFFNMYIPEEAFVSDFKMKIKDHTYVANVLKNEEAERKFDGSDDSAGKVSNKVDFKGTNHVSMIKKYLLMLLKLLAKDNSLSLNLSCV